MAGVGNVPIALVLCAALVAPDSVAPSPRSPAPEIAEDAVTPAGADESPARRNFLRGRELYLAGDYAAAIAAFETAYDLSGDRNLLYNIALAYDRSGDLERAIHYFERYRDLSPAEERAEIEVRLAGLRQRMAQRSAATTDPVPSRSESSTSTLPPTTDDAPRPSRASERGPKHAIAAGQVALAVLAAAGFAVGTGFGAASRIASREAAPSCGRLCREEAEPHLVRARNYAIGADVAFVFGGAAAAAFVTLLAIDIHRTRRSRVSASRSGTARLPITW